jgi:hypothetical protein
MQMVTKLSKTVASKLRATTTEELLKLAEVLQIPSGQVLT